MQPTETERRTTIRTCGLSCNRGTHRNTCTVVIEGYYIMLDIQKHYVEVAMYDYLPG